MAKRRKKLHCICGGRTDRVLPGSDRQKHTERCPLALQNNKMR